MRIPLSWLREYCDPGLGAEALADVLTIGGLAVEAVHRPTAGTRGVVVAEVLDLAPIAGSDKLHLVHVTTDRSDTHEIVCGASNFSPGDRVPAALPGASLPGPDPARPFEIGRREIFGHTSNGMLASPRELRVGDDHSGIWVLDADAPLGADLAGWLGLDDAILELEVTPDRGYGLSLVGVARDVAALTGAALHLPDVAAPPAGGAGVPVEVAEAGACARFDARRISGVRPAAPSPAWAQVRLAAAGMRPISAVVDATNLAMLETGHPAHAYDLGALAGPRIDVRYARPGERLVTLDGVDRECDPDDLVIADADGPVGFAGVMGGERTEVGARTSTVLLEVAAFDARAVLRTARRHQLLSEASRRFEKTVPAATVPFGAGRCAELIVAFAGGDVTGHDDRGGPPPPREAIRLRPERVRSVLGLDLSDARQRELLERIDCEVSVAGGAAAGEGGASRGTPESVALGVVPPGWRPDLRIEVDLLEELVRLHGYGEVGATVPSSGQAGGREPRDEAARAVRRALAGAGWSEALTLPFAPPGDADLLGFGAGDRRREPIALVNPLSKEESVLRTTLLPGLLRAVRRNVNRQVTDVAAFEVGRVFVPPTPDDPGADGGPHGVALPAEPLMLGFAACGRFEAPRHDRPGRGVDLYDLLGAVEVVRLAVGLERVEVHTVETPPYHPGRAAAVLLDGVEIGVVGELLPRVAEMFEVPPRTLAGELRLDAVVAGGVRPARPSVPSSLPGVRFDVAVEVAEAVPAGVVEAAVRAGASAGVNLTECRLFDVFRGSQLGEGNKSLAYALRLDEHDRQLTDDDVTAAIERIEAEVAQRAGGRLRR